MMEPIPMEGVMARWLCGECSSVLLSEPGAERLQLAERDPCTKRLLGLPRRGITYCICDECCTEWLYEEDRTRESTKPALNG